MKKSNLMYWMEWAIEGAHVRSSLFLITWILEKLASNSIHNKHAACKTHKNQQQQRQQQHKRPVTSSEITSKTYSILCPIKIDQPKNWLGHGKLSIKSSCLNNVSIEMYKHIYIMYRQMNVVFCFGRRSYWKNKPKRAGKKTSNTSNNNSIVTIT